MEQLSYRVDSLVEVAYKALKKDIVKQILVPGEKIIIRELSERYQISETPIKQALNRLIAEGLIESIPRRGAWIRQIAWTEIADLMDIRFMIETHWIAKIMKRFQEDLTIREQFLKNTQNHSNLIQHVLDVDDYFENYSLDKEFHQLLVQCTSNRYILQMYNNLGTHAYANYVYGRQKREGMIEGVREHERIYEALVQQDETKIRETLECHLINAKKNVYQMLHEKTAEETI